MASNQVSAVTKHIFLGILCILLLLASGPAADAFNVPIACQGPCSKIKDCGSYCIAKGFPKAGACYFSGGGDPAGECCCNV
ncbi:defensin-like protein 78 [Ziziphus jujuba]|uniref:Defensin-like protein 78 n=1 Tax=Ziziphus jujuba TaxID=326968 RepID=A0ABM3ICH3_ZIZJJ|nr:defensin-like protein 78 [Ziziphus jujuba]XP_060675452.1 defensin-like protein 78 [Ziziphus jujuba]